MSWFIIRHRSHPCFGRDFTLAKELTWVGEYTGKLDVMLMRTADILDEDVKNLVDRLMALLVPVGMGLLIAGMIASILLGIMSINEIAY